MAALRLRFSTTKWRKLLGFCALTAPKIRFINVVGKTTENE
jgi:hypothetical protein